MTTSAEIREKTNPKLLDGAGQTYLAGDEIYLRSITPADAEYASAWHDSVFPHAPERVRDLINDELAVEHGGATLLIVPIGSDRPVGSMHVEFKDFPHHEITVHVDPLEGDRGQRWKGEALALTMNWLVEELQRPKAGTIIPASETAVREAIEAIGARVTGRFREMLSQPGGARDDALVVELLSPAWMNTLGNPAHEEIPRTGTGQPRPVTAPVVPTDDPPANAIRVGPRVYLRAPLKADADAVAHWSTREIDPSWDNGRFPTSREGMRKWFDDVEKKTPPEWLEYSVCLRGTDEYLGMVGVINVDYRHGFGESVSMVLNPHYREAGYGSEAKHLMFDHVFNTVGLHSLQSWVMFQNPRSAAALRKQGYREVGRDHWIDNRDGRWASFVLFELLADEWRAMPRHEMTDNT